MTFFRMVTAGGTAASESVLVANGRWQDILQAGNIIFLLRAHGDWWQEERITADLIDSDTDGRATVDVTPLRDALLQKLQDLGPWDMRIDRPARGAVSAADGHFIFHLSTQGGAKVAAALRLPAHIPPQHGASAAVDSGVAFARRWPQGHAMADLSMPNEAVRRVSDALG